MDVNSEEIVKENNLSGGEGNNNSKRKIRNMIIICIIAALLFIAATYAWFIGMRTVKVNSFDVTIAATDSLLLSLDGKKWDTTVKINGSNFNDPKVVYEGNANTWSNGGLVPVSSIGEMDKASSRMKIFEKGSLTPTDGGYRLMAGQLNNYTETVDDQPWQFKEERGYVAFDLFIKNFSGHAYYKENNEANEEAIYLTTDSFAGLAVDGVPDTGIENTVRVAFAEIGRVSAKTYDPKIITSITCTDSPNDGPVTGICRKAQIWEPNDTKHAAATINYFNKTCKKRVGNNVFDKGAYSSSPCDPLEDGKAVETYVVSAPITNPTNTDIYDGLNGYTAGSGLTHIDTFTDAERDLENENRKQFISLAPNSVTKLRIYVYIEGQDVDNYSIASIGKKISVGFGLTKDRFDFVEDDDYIDNVVKNDHTKPVISFKPNDETGFNVQKISEEEYSVTIAKNTEFDPKSLVTANDTEEGDITSRINIINNTVNTRIPGEYLVSYLISDWAGNYSEISLKVIVTDTP